MDPVNGAVLHTQPRPASRDDGVVPIRISPSARSSAQAESPRLPESSSDSAMPVDAYKTNERLFPIFKNGLSDEKGYVSSAKKLADWLRLSKAFYPAARPWIVSFLETAQITMRKACSVVIDDRQPFHVSQCPSGSGYWVDPYLLLVRAVRKHERMFIEPELRRRLEALFRTVEPVPHLSTGVYTGPVQRPPTTPISPVFSAPPFVVPHYNTPASSSRSPQIPSPAYSSPTPELNPYNQQMMVSPAYPSPVTAGPFVTLPPFTRPPLLPVGSSRPSSVHSHTPPTAKSSSPMNAPPPATPTSSTASPAADVPSASSAPSVAPKPKLKPKIKARKLSGLVGAFDYLDSDLEWYMKQKEKEKEKGKEIEAGQGTAPEEKKPNVTVNDSVPSPEGVTAEAHGEPQRQDTEESRQSSTSGSSEAVQRKVEAERTVTAEDKQTNTVTSAPEDNSQARYPSQVELQAVLLSGPKPPVDTERVDVIPVAVAVDAGTDWMPLVEEEIQSDTASHDKALAEGTSTEGVDALMEVDVPSEPPASDSVERQSPSTNSDGVQNPSIAPSTMMLDPTTTVSIATSSAIEVDAKPAIVHSVDETKEDTLPSPATTPLPPFVPEVPQVPTTEHTELSMPVDKIPDATVLVATPSVAMASPDVVNHDRVAHTKEQCDILPMATPPTSSAATSSALGIPQSPSIPTEQAIPHLDLSTKIRPSSSKPVVKVKKSGRKGPPGLRILPIRLPSDIVLEISSGLDEPSAMTLPTDTVQPAVEPQTTTPKPVKAKRRGPPGIRASDLSSTTVPQAPDLSDRESSPETALLSSVGKSKSPSLPKRRARSTSSDSDSPLANRRKLSTSVPQIKLSALSFPLGFLGSDTTSLSSIGNNGTSSVYQEMKVDDGPHTNPESLEEPTQDTEMRDAKPGEVAAETQSPESQLRQRDYTLDAFASGSFVYSPKQMGEFEEGQLTSSSQVAISNIERELGEITPMVETNLIEGSLLAALSQSKTAWQVIGESSATLPVKTNNGLGLYLVPPPPLVPHDDLFTSGMRVLAFERGASRTNSMVLSFELQEEHFVHLRSWVNRYAANGDMVSCQCLSLGCYLYSECCKMLPGRTTPVPDELFSKCPIQWPLRAHPRATINDGKGQGHSFPITPLSVDKDNLVDISARVQPGKNSVVIESAYGDTQDYVFVVHLHPPTATQLLELQRRKDQETAWQQFLKGCTKIELPQLSAYLDLDASVLAT